MNNFYDNDINNDNFYYEGKKRRKGKSYIAVILATSIVSSAVTGGVLNYRFTDKINQQLSQIQQTNQVPNLQKTIESSSDKATISKAVSTLETGSSVSAIAKKAGPSVVGIRLTVANPQSTYSRAMQDQSSSEGSGIIMSKDGYIMTNYHVVEYADPKSGYSKNATLEVFLPDKRQAKATFIGGDSKNDLAVIKIDLDNLPVAELGDSSRMEVGDLAVAIGNPLGMEFAGSVTVGVISALNRQVETEDKTLNLIQTDAAINPGNSGGALVNSQGQIVGINTIKISVSGVEGLGFAIPMNDAKPIVEQLIQYGYVKGRPLMGISGREITTVMAQQYGLPQGIYITETSSESGAQAAGIKKGDVLISLADKDVKTMKDLDNIKKSYKAGDTVNVVVVRNNSKVNLKMTFSEER
jgi:serine protease Do